MATVMSGLPIPAAARVLTTTLMMLTTVVLAFCLTRRIGGLRKWRTMQVPQWLVMAIYMDSLLFILMTAILTKSFNLNDDYQLCDGAILLCIVCYMSTKVLLYYFLVEKVYVIRNPWTSRLKDKLYLFNVFGVIVPYVVLVILAFIYRIAYIDKSGKCVIGVKAHVLFPLTSFEVVLNVYLTTLFLRPLKKLYDGDENTQHSQGGTKQALKTMATRTFIGSCVTLTSTAINLGALAGLEGERGWICLMLCNLDILFAVSVLHWATSLDKSVNHGATTATPTSNKTGAASVGVASEDEPRERRAGSIVSQNAFRNWSGRGSISGIHIPRKPSVALTWEDMQLNQVNFDNKLDGICEEAEIRRKDISDMV